jgi:hypothetical protein
VTTHLGPLIAEATDPEAVTRFWAAALGETACRRHLIIGPQRQEKVVKNRVHLDVYVRDVAPLLALGAAVLAEYLPDRVTLADVDGNEFCAFIDPDALSESGPPARVFAVCTDSDRPEELAEWWAPLVGAAGGCRGRSRIGRHDAVVVRIGGLAGGRVEVRTGFRRAGGIQSVAVECDCGPGRSARGRRLDLRRGPVRRPSGQ